MSGGFGFNQNFSATDMGGGGFGGGFSGPLVPPSPTGFVTAGLVLRYEIDGGISYPGGGITVYDLESNSDATLVNSPTYTPHYLEFDGVNQYLMTDTSLVPVVTGTVTTIMMWAYPMDDGVLLTEQGVSSLNAAWHDSQMEIVGGDMHFGMWNGSGHSSVVSSIATPLNNWYHFAMVYDGTKMDAYVNGEIAGTVTFSRSIPSDYGNGLHYAIAANDSTSMGDGTYANMRLGEFLVYNTALTSSEVKRNYNATKASYPNIPPVAIIQDHLELWFDARYPASYPGTGTSWTDMKNGIVATMGGGVSYDGMVQTMVFDGSGGAYASTPSYVSDMTSGYSLEAYVRWDNLPSYDGVVAYNDSPRFTNIEYYSPGVRFEGAGSQINDGSAPTLGTFYHIVATWDGSFSRLYRDGALVGIPAPATQVQSSMHTAQWIMGQWDGNLNGAITMTRLYTKALSDAEVLNNYNATLAGV